MGHPLRSMNAVRDQLGGHYTRIKEDLDPRSRERAKDAALKSTLRTECGAACAIEDACHPSGRVTAPLELAHLVPVHSGGRTEQCNVLLLCKDCHRNWFEKGCVSVENMRRIAQHQKQGRRSPRPAGKKQRSTLSPTITQPPQEVAEDIDGIKELARIGHNRKATSRIDALLNRKRWSETTKSYLLIQKAGYSRCRSAYDGLVTARNILIGLPTETIRNEDLAHYYYEHGYVLRLLGEHQLAAKSMKRSATLSECNPLAKVPAQVNQLLSLLANTENPTASDIAKWQSLLAQSREIAERYPGPHGGGWIFNCAFHQVQIHLKLGNGEDASQALKHAEKLYWSSDVTTGWFASSGPLLASLKGLLRVLHPRATPEAKDVERGVGLLARAFVARNLNGVRPELIRDIGYGLAIGLRKTGNHKDVETARVLQDTMDCLQDGTSVVWPWRAVDDCGG